MKNIRPHHAQILFALLSACTVTDNSQHNPHPNSGSDDTLDDDAGTQAKLQIPAGCADDPSVEGKIYLQLGVDHLRTANNGGLDQDEECGHVRLSILYLTKASAELRRVENETIAGRTKLDLIDLEKLYTVAEAALMPAYELAMACPSKVASIPSADLTPGCPGDFFKRRTDYEMQRGGRR